MQSLVTAYQNVAAEWRQSPQLMSSLSVEQRSREMLVMWIAFCLVHRKCVKEVPLCAEYSIALNWQDLKVAVFSDRAAISALVHVAQYIRGWNEKTSGPALFHLTDQGPTLAFGREFGLSSTDMIDTYNREVFNWEEHVQTKWAEVEAKKRLAVELRAKISRLTQNLQSKELDLEKEELRLREAYPPQKSFRQSAAKKEFTADIGGLHTDIENNEKNLKNALATPPPLIRPLPAEKDDAIQVIWMLTIPRNVEILGNLCLTAQRALAPVKTTPGMKELPTLNPTTWQQFYHQHAPAQSLRATASDFSSYPAVLYLPGKSYGPKTVDGLSHISQFKAQCVWSPSVSGTAFTWIDKAGETLNPFKATPISVINSYIELLPESFAHLQWMNAWPGENDTRGNLVYANLHQQPEAFEKVSFIALGSLRAFPNQQYRKLQWALLEDVFAWSHPCVQTIVRQSLCQVGVLTDENEPMLLWKTDMPR